MMFRDGKEMIPDGKTVVRTGDMIVLASYEFENDDLIYLKELRIKPTSQLKKAKEVEAKSNELFDYIQTFKYEMVKIADGSSADKNAIDIRKKDDTNASGTYGIVQGHGKELKNRIDEYREFLKKVYGGNNEEKNAEYDKVPHSR